VSPLSAPALPRPLPLQPAPVDRSALLAQVARLLSGVLDRLQLPPRVPPEDRQ
jgi:hypothetical protein